MKKNIAIVAGGNSSEVCIAEKCCRNQIVY